MLTLDHLAVAAGKLEEGRAYVEEALGVALEPGGQHAHFGTHNMLLGLEEGLYLEVIAIDPTAMDSARPRWFDLDRFDGSPRLTTWICRSDNLEADLVLLPGAGSPVPLFRGDLAWRMAVPESGVLPFDNCHPAIMQWDGTAHPAARLKASGCRLSGLVVRHPEAELLKARLAPRLTDVRVTCETGAPGLEARFDTPSGPRSLG